MSVDAFLTPTYPINWAELPIADLPAALDKGLIMAKAALKKVEETPLEKVSYDSIATALEEFNEPLFFAWEIAKHLANVDDSDEIRAAINKYTPQITELSASIPFSAPLWERLKRVDATGLDPVQTRHLETLKRYFIKSGADLPQDKKDELMGHFKRLSELGNSFKVANIDAVKAFQIVITDKSLLTGIPETDLATAAKSAKAKGLEGWRFTLQAPSLMAVLTHADNVELRKQMWTAFNDICVEDPNSTLPFVKEILERREKVAQISGFKNYADYATTETMVKGGEAITEFLDTLNTQSRPLAERDFAKLVAFKRDGLHDETPLAPWDAGYVYEKLQQAELKFSTEETRPYFPFENVMGSLMELTETLFGVKVKKVEGHKTWHAEAGYYEMTDTATGKLLGGFYTDFFPRETKRGGAWMDNILTGKPDAEGKLSPHIGFIGGNFSSPSEGTPALLTHGETTTFFHEFGHLLHHMLTEVKIPALAGVNVPYDWVELPSQLLENYCYHPEFLRRIGKHHQTGEVIPDAMIAKIQESAEFMEGMACNRQLSIGAMDIYLHTTPAENITGDIEGALRKRLKPFSFPFSVEPRPFVRRFTHIFSGEYPAKYYSYKWTEMLAAHMWKHFEAKGPLSRQLGTAYRAGILAKGNSEDPKVLWNKFMGCEPSMQPLIEGMGTL